MKQILAILLFAFINSCIMADVRDNPINVDINLCNVITPPPPKTPDASSNDYWNHCFSDVGVRSEVPQGGKCCNNSECAQGAFCACGTCTKVRISNFVSEKNADSGIRINSQ